MTTSKPRHEHASDSSRRNSSSYSRHRCRLVALRVCLALAPETLAGRQLSRASWSTDPAYVNLRYTGTLGLAVGTGVGIARDLPLGLSAVATGVKWFTLTSSFWRKWHRDRWIPFDILIRASVENRHHGSMGRGG